MWSTRNYFWTKKAINFLLTNKLLGCSWDVKEHIDGDIWVCWKNEKTSGHKLLGNKYTPNSVRFIKEL